MAKNNRITIGLVGHPSCGKDTVANYLVKKYGFQYVSTSNIVRDYIKKNKLGEPTRDLMRKTANELRQNNGPDFLVREVLKEGRGRLVFGGIRAVAEAGAVKIAGGIIMAVTAAIEIRFARAKARGRIGDGVSFESFKDLEKKEMANSNPSAQNVNAVITEADFVIDNSGALDNLYKQVDKVTESL